jgi:phosphoserine phosphatase
MKTAIIRLDGILAPPIWQQIAQVARIPDLVTSNEMWIVDNIALKKKRMSLLKQHGIKRDDLQFIVSMHSPYKGAAAFVKALRRDHRVIAVTNAPRQLAHHFTKILGSIELHSEFDACGSQSSLTDQANRLPSQRTIDANTSSEETLVIGHALSDMPMLMQGARRYLFRPSKNTARWVQGIPVVQQYHQMLDWPQQDTFSRWRNVPFLVESASACVR